MNPLDIVNTFPLVLPSPIGRDLIMTRGALTPTARHPDFPG